MGREQELRYVVTLPISAAAADVAGATADFIERIIRTVGEPARRSSSDEQAEVVCDDEPISPGMQDVIDGTKAKIRAAFADTTTSPAVAAGGVTEAVLDKAFLDFIRGRDAAIDARPQMVDLNQVVRAGLREALTASLAVGDEGIREGWQPIETLKDREGRYLFWLDWSDDCAPLNPPLPVSHPGRWHTGRYGSWTSVYKASHWRSPLPPQLLPAPPSRGEGE